MSFESFQFLKFLNGKKNEIFDSFKYLKCSKVFYILKILYWLKVSNSWMYPTLNISDFLNVSNSLNTSNILDRSKVLKLLDLSYFKRFENLWNFLSRKFQKYLKKFKIAFQKFERFERNLLVSEVQNCWDLAKFSKEWVKKWEVIFFLSFCIWLKG